MMRHLPASAALVGLLVVGPAAAAATAMRTAIDRPESAGAHFGLTLSSPAIRANGVIPRKYVLISPPLAWTPVPGAASYVVIVEDADAGDRSLGIPFVHWLAWNIPAMARTLSEGISGKPGGMIVEGRNQAGKLGYFGPHPPPGPPHHYHFELLALSSPINLPAGSSREQLLEAIEGRVVGKGELVARYASDG